MLIDVHYFIIRVVKVKLRSRRLKSFDLHLRFVNGLLVDRAGAHLTQPTRMEFDRREAYSTLSAYC